MRSLSFPTLETVRQVFIASALHAALMATAYGESITGMVPVGRFGHELYYEVDGSGEPVVLIHGLTLDLREWDAQVDALAEKYQVIRYDVVGHGRSTGLSSSLPNEAVRDWDYLRELLDELDVDKAHVMGLSMGGGIAINFALQYPDRVQTLTPIDARLGGYNVASELETRFFNYINVSESQGVQSALPLWATDPLFAPANSNPEVHRKLEEIVVEGHGALGAGAMFQWPNLLKVAGLSPSAMSRLDEIEHPTLVMIGELDLVDFQKQADILDRDIPNSTKLIVPNAGHMSDMEQPEFVNAALLDFFATYPISIMGDCDGDSIVNIQDANCTAEAQLDDFLAALKPRSLRGDVDGDGKVQFSDFLILADNFGQPGDYTSGDFDKDGKIQFSDFLILSNNFGRTGSSTAAVPEGTASSLTLLGLAGLLMRPRCTRNFARD